MLTPQASAPQCPNPSSFTSGFSSRPIEVSPVSQDERVKIQLATVTLFVGMSSSSAVPGARCVICFCDCKPMLMVSDHYS